MRDTGRVRVLVVDDDEAVRSALTHALHRDGLGQAFAAMTAALDESVGAQRRLVADASHELRTPLTSLITSLELLAEQPARAAGRAPGLRYELDCRPTLVCGDPDALERAIGNLVDNALKWSPPDGRIRISAAAGTVEVIVDQPAVARPRHAASSPVPAPATRRR